MNLHTEVIYLIAFPSVLKIPTSDQDKLDSSLLRERMVDFDEDNDDDHGKV